MNPWGDAISPILALVLLAIGLLCLLTRRRVIKQVIGLSIMLQGALVSVMGAGQATGRKQVSQNMIISALVVEAIILAIMLALTINVFRYHPEGWIDDLDTLKG